MDMRQEIRQKLGQTLVMTPKLQQAIKLLQVTGLELQQILKQELIVNPMLEEVEEVEEVEEDAAEERVEEAPAGEDEGEFKTSEETIDWDRYLKDGFEMSDRASGGVEEQEEFQDRAPVARTTLSEYLASQLRMATASEEDRRIGEFIIGSLDANGFLTASVEDMAGLLAAEPARVAEVVALVRTFDPAGIGAGDLRQCLLLQLEQAGLGETLAATLVRDHLDDLLEKRSPEIARNVKKTVQDVQAAAEVVAKLDPRPGSRYAVEEPRYIVPDLVVDKVEDHYVVQINDRNVPRLRVNRAYREILSDAKASTKQDHDYVVEKLNAARWLIKTIDQRRRTMVRVMEAILEVQMDFFEKGIEHLKPLTLQQIAERVSMHESTVSRVTNSKYVQTPRGVFELKYFFSTGLRTEDGEAASSKKIKAIIEDLIHKENRNKPLSDQEIGEILKREGYFVARRTVAKYRDQLGIFSARKRKQY